MPKKRTSSHSVDDFARVFQTLLAFALAAFFGVLLFYFARFGHRGISGRTEDWAAFGEYVGGTLGGILGLLSFIGVVSTVVLMRNQLDFAKGQANRDELQRLVASASASVDALLAREFDDGQLPGPLHQRRPNQTQTLGQLIAIGARAATLQERTAIEDYLVTARNKQKADAAKDFLAPHAEQLIDELGHMSEALAAYEHAAGSSEVGKIYVGRVRKYVRWLRELGFALPEGLANRLT